MNTALLIIDPQNDFCSPNGSLYVPGAEEDTGRLAEFIKKNIGKIDQIHVTLDSHPTYHIAHPLFWKDETGKPPAEYTIITCQDFKNGKYTTADPELAAAAEEYLLALENRGRYNLTIWPLHCISATWGFCVEEKVWKAVHEWELATGGKNCDFIHKSASQMTEHYSAIQAEVPDPNDASTRTNFPFVDTLKAADTILVAGEALSHCVANTLRDLAVYIPSYRITVLTDCTSSVAGFESVGEEFIKEYQAKGMVFEKSTDFVFQ